LELILFTVNKQFENRLHLLMPVVDKVLRSIDQNTDDLALQRLVALSKCVTNFSYAVKEFQYGVDSVLQTEEEVKNLLISKEYLLARNYAQNQNSTIPIHPAIEMGLMLGDFSKKAEEMYNELGQITQNIATTSKHIEISLDVTRNKLVKLSLQVAMATMVLGGGATVASIFGMNLLNGLEAHPHAFYYCVSAVLGNCAIFLWFCLSNIARAQKGYGTRTAHPNTFFESINDLEYVNSIYNCTTKDEFRGILEATVGRPVSVIEVDQIFEQYDINRDGVLDKEEFRKAVNDQKVLHN